MKAPPPSPEDCGSTRPNVACTAIAASTAEPPSRKIFKPASVAKGLAAATIPVCGAGVFTMFTASVVGAASTPLQAVRRRAVVRRRYFIWIALGQRNQRGNALFRKLPCENADSPPRGLIALLSPKKWTVYWFERRLERLLALQMINALFSFQSFPIFARGLAYPTFTSCIEGFG